MFLMTESFDFIGASGWRIGESVQFAPPPVGTQNGAVPFGKYTSM